jgi:hypothetical protein
MLRAPGVDMAESRQVSRRRFTVAGAATILAAGVEASTGLPVNAVGQQANAGQAQGAAAARPEALRSEFLMDIVLDTQPSIALGPRTIVSVTGGTFEGPKLRGTVAPPGADWPLAVNPNLRILDVRTLLVTDDDQRIYMTYRGVIYTPPAGQGQRYWRTVPIFETASPKYEWLTQAVFVGVSFQVPQRVSYRIFQIL